MRVLDFSEMNKRGGKSTHFTEAEVKGEAYRRPRKGNPSIRLASTVSSGETSICGADQVHLSLGNSEGSVIISYATYNYSNPARSIVEYSTNVDDLSNGKGTVVTGQSNQYSNIISIVSSLYDPNMGVPYATSDEIVAKQDTTSWAYDKTTGELWAPWANVTEVELGLGSYQNPYMLYDSPLLHKVELTNLPAGQTIYYLVSNCTTVFSFQLAYPGSDKNVYPMKIGLTADLGMTDVSNASMYALLDFNPAVVLLAGDLSYADGYIERWDSFGRMVQPVASQIPFLTTGGNHEIQCSEAWSSYMHRWPTPFKGSGSSNFCYYGKEIGPVHLITLCSYANFNESSPQYQWLKSYLSTNIDREKTPWLIAMMHVPWYNSNAGHWKEGELMRLAMEPLLYEYGVDAVLSGHVHTYERTAPTYNNEVDECGPTYLNIGDGGNYEGTYTHWRDPEVWTVFRESSFGIGRMTVHNETTISFDWNRYACQNISDIANHAVNWDYENCISYASYWNLTGTYTAYDNSAQAYETSDSTVLQKPSRQSCPNKYLSSPSVTPDTGGDSGGNNDDDDDDSYKDHVIAALSALTTLFGLSTAVLSYFLYNSKEKVVYYDSSNTVNALRAQLNPDNETSQMNARTNEETL